MVITGINVYRAMIGEGVLLSLTHEVTIDGKPVERHEYVRLNPDTAYDLSSALTKAVVQLAYDQGETEDVDDHSYDDDTTVAPTILGKDFLNPVDFGSGEQA